MMTEFQIRKMDVLFDAYDGNKDGYLEATDFDRPAERFDARMGTTGPGERPSAWWRGFWQGMTPLADSDGRVSRAAWLAYLDGVWSDPATFDQLIQGGVSLYIAVVDTNGDGMLSLDEYRHLFYALSLDEGMVDDIFPRLDADGDGYLSREELAQRVREFYDNDPDAPGNWLMGAF